MNNYDSIKPSENEAPENNTWDSLSAPDVPEAPEAPETPKFPETAEVSNSSDSLKIKL